MTTNIDIICFPGAPNLPIFVAQEKGLFEQAGVTVNLTTTPSSAFQACRAADVSHETKITSVSASWNDCRFASRSSASSLQTGVKANGWNTSRTLRLPLKSCKRTRGLS